MRAFRLDEYFFCISLDWILSFFLVGDNYTYKAILIFYITPPLFLRFKFRFRESLKKHVLPMASKWTRPILIGYAL